MLGELKDYYSKEEIQFYYYGADYFIKLLFFLKNDRENVWLKDGAQVDCPSTEGMTGARHIDFVGRSAFWQINRFESL